MKIINSVLKNPTPHPPPHDLTVSTDRESVMY